MRVISNTAISLDGRINTREGRFVSLGSAEDLRRMSVLRAQADAVLVGGATFRNWPNPSLPEPEHDVGPPRSARPYNVVVTRSLSVPLAPNFLHDPRIRPLFLTLRDALPPDFPAEAEGYAGPGRDLPVPWLLEVLERRGVEVLLVEAGGDLLAQFLAAGALDELNVTVCPALIGGDTPSIVDGPGFFAAQVPRLRLTGCDRHGDELFLTYAVKRPADAAR